MDLADLAEFGRAWLLSDCQKPACLADLAGNQAVSQMDLLLFTAQWLRDDNDLYADGVEVAVDAVPLDRLLSAGLIKPDPPLDRDRRRQPLAFAR